MVPLCGLTSFYVVALPAWLYVFIPNDTIPKYTIPELPISRITVRLSAIGKAPHTPEECIPGPGPRGFSLTICRSGLNLGKRLCRDCIVGNGPFGIET